MNRKWRWVLPCYLLLLPNAMVALVYAFCVGARSWEWRDGVLTFVSDRLVGDPGGQGWSWIVGYASEEQRNRPDLRVHENTHVVQEFCCSLVGLGLGGAVALLCGLGPLGTVLALCSGGALFAIMYAVLFLYYYLTEQEDEQSGWRDDYRRNPFERQAYSVQKRYLTSPENPRIWGSRGVS